MIVVIFFAVQAALSLPLDVSRCPVPIESELRRIVTLELSTLLQHESNIAVRAQVTCSESFARIEVAERGRTLSRILEVDAKNPQLTARQLAIALSELVMTASEEPRPAAIVAGARSSPAPPPQPSSALRIQAVGGLLGFGSRVDTLWGGGLRLGQDLARPTGLCWTFEADAHHASEQVSAGLVEVNLFTASFQLLLRHDWPHAAMRIGIGARGGAVELRGSPAPAALLRGRTLWSGWGGPAAAVGIAASPLRPLLIDLQMEAGISLTPVVGTLESAPAVTIDGPWLGLFLGVGFSR